MRLERLSSHQNFEVDFLQNPKIYPTKSHLRSTGEDLKTSADPVTRCGTPGRPQTIHVNQSLKPYIISLYRRLMMSIPTPPPTSLSPQPSPTTENPDLPRGMTSVPSVRPLYLIVATSLSPPLGIGLNGTLPWPPLKSDMSFFARVTKRAPSSGGKNVVIMGRKTYESIPPKFRPLQNRKNVIITRSGAQALQERLRNEVDEVRRMDIYCVPSLQDAVTLVRAQQEGKTFIIGGAQIYKAALEEEYQGAFTHLRILQTEIQKNSDSSLEIDTFFPVDIRKEPSWRQAEDREVAEWVGEDVPQIKSGDKSWKEDGDFKIRTLGWEKELPMS